MLYMNQFFKQQKGGLAIIFAIILPFIFSLCALAFDGARVLSKKARLADALNEAGIAIATASTAKPNDEEKIKLNLILNQYINSYLPNENIIESDIKISYITEPETNTEVPVFTLNAKIEVNTLLPLSMSPAFSPTLELVNKGKVRKGIQNNGRPADYIFVVGFSGSMNDPSVDDNLTRLQLLKKVVKDITTTALDTYPETTFAIVPFENGVPIKWESRQYVENELTGNPISGCSLLMVPNEYYSDKLKMPIGYDLNYTFWSNKTRALMELPAPSDNATNLPYTLEEVTKLIDAGRYNYFARHVLPGLQETNPLATWQTLVDLGWCKQNVGVPEPSYNCGTTRPLCVQEAPYSCEKNISNSIFTDENQKIIKNEIEQARRVFISATNVDPAAPNAIYGAMYYLESINIRETLIGMFDRAHIVDFPLAYRDMVYDYKLHSSYAEGMCLSGRAGSGTLKNLRPTTYLIEPTNNLALLNEFQDMIAYGGTNSSSGLLRAVPEMLQGNNPRKVMIVISDGDDNAAYQPLTDKLHINERVCDKIRSGVKNRANAEEVDIYFISVVDDEDAKKRTKYWADYCTGQSNAVIATNYDEIMAKMIEIMNKYEETGYFTN